MTYQKKIVPHPDLYVCHFIKPDCHHNLIFIHGGPGFNCGTLEFFIEHDNIFKSLNYNIILYDQRACGRSKKQEAAVSHHDNINDLNELIMYLMHNQISVSGLIGHSYGAKLLLDFYKLHPVKIPGIFIGIADSMLTPRLNNFMSDLVYLKKTDSVKYQKILSTLDSSLNIEALWSLTEELSSLFQENQDRPFQAWGNLNYMKRSQEIQKLINIPTNQNILMDVRKNIYRDETYCRVDIDSLAIPYLWINGLHDYAMNGAAHLFSHKNVKVFYQSGHYPHIEENQTFCESVNEFFEAL